MVMCLCFSIFLQAQEEQKVFVQKEGKLGSQIKDAKNVKKLTISGAKLNQKDFQALTKCTSLEYLDISGVEGIWDKIAFKSSDCQPLPQLKELTIKYYKPTDLKSSADGYYDNIQEPYYSDLIIFNNIRDIYDQVSKLKEFAPNIKQCTIKNITEPCNLSFETPEKLIIWNKRSNGFKTAISLQEGAAYYEAIDNDELSINDCHLIYGVGQITDPKQLELKNAFYIGMQSFNIDIKKIQIKEFVIPKQIRYIDYEGFNFLNGNKEEDINIIAEESDNLLRVVASGILTHGKSNKFEFNRPVYISSGAFSSSEVKQVFFNKGVEYLGKESFKEVEEIRFKECPEKLADYIVGYPKKIQRVYVPSSSLTKFKGLGAKNIDSVIGSK